MRIAILTFHRAYNCGAVLQAWALQTVLERMGHQVVFPDVNSVGVEFRWPQFYRSGLSGKIRNLIGWCYSQIVNRFIPMRKCWAFWKCRKRMLHCSDASMIRSCNCDFVIVGSDQVWNPKCTGEKVFPIFLGSGIDMVIPMIGYALSGGDRGIDKRWLDEMTSAANTRFKAVSYREAFLREQVKVEGPIVCDPTLLVKREDYESVELKRRLVRGRYVFVYAVSDSEDVIPVAKQIAKRLGLKLFAADVYRGADSSKNIQNDDCALTPDKLLAHIRDAEYVIASSFHGCVLSMQYHKKFVCLYGKSGAVPNGRQQTLLSMAGVADRRFSCHSDIESITQKLKEEYSLSDKLSVNISSSMSWLDSVLK